MTHYYLESSGWAAYMEKPKESFAMNHDLHPSVKIKPSKPKKNRSESVEMN